MKYYHKQIWTYWSLSAPIKWLRTKAGLENPYALSSEDWDEHRKACKEKAPFVEWFTNSFVNKVQRIVRIPLNLVYSVKVYYKNCKGNTHVLDGGLKKGVWYDLPYRIQHCLFNELVKYVEQEKGLEHLEWELGLVYNEEWGVNKDDPKYGTLTDQALSAAEQKALYSWWKYERPTRIDPHDASGLTAYYEQQRKEGKSLLHLANGKDEDWKEMHDKCSEMELQYSQEDDSMLLRLIKIKDSLWS